GSFEELAIFNRPLDPEEIQTNYQNTASLAAQGPIGAEEAALLLSAAQGAASARILMKMRGTTASAEASASGYIEILIDTNNSNVLRLLLHNSEPGQTYHIWRKVEPGPWRIDHSVIGATSQTVTETTVDKTQFPFSFFQASLGTFLGI